MSAQNGHVKTGREKDGTRDSQNGTKSHDIKTVALYESQGVGPFGNFIVVALSTLLTILLAWRVLFEDENSIRSPSKEGGKSKLSPSTTAPNASKVEPAAAKPLATQMASDDDPQGGYESDVSTAEEDPDLHHLDTITEEDTDDLRSLSSNDGWLSPPRGHLRSHTRPLAIQLPQETHLSGVNYPLSIASERQVRNGHGAQTFVDELHGLNSTKSPNEERFLRAYQNYVTAAAAQSDITSSTATLSEEIPERSGTNFDGNCTASDDTLPSSVETELDDNTPLQKLANHAEPYRDAEESTTMTESVASTLTGEDQYSWLEISPSNHSPNTTVHSLSHTDCVANALLHSYSPLGASDLKHESPTPDPGEGLRRNLLAVAPKPAVRLDRENCTLLEYFPKASPNLRDNLRGKNKGDLDPGETSVIENNKTSPSAMSGFMKEECSETLNSTPTDSLRVQFLNSPPAGEQAINNNPRLISTVQYRPPGLSIRHSNNPAHLDENSNMAHDSYRYERYQRSVEMVAQESGPDAAYQIHSREFSEEIRGKPPPTRGRIPWATASVFPARNDVRSEDYRRGSSEGAMSPSRVKVTSYDSSPVTPIPPPSDLREVSVERSVVKPKLIGAQYVSSDELQKMIKPYKSDKDLTSSKSMDGRDRTDQLKRQASKDTSLAVERGSLPSKDEFKSKDSLQQETKKSVETLFPVTPPGSTGRPTKTEPRTYPTEKGAPLKRPVPLNERNLEWWTSLPQNQPDNSQHLMRWRHSINLSDELLNEEKEKERQPQKEPQKMVNGDVGHSPPQRREVKPKLVGGQYVSSDELRRMTQGTAVRKPEPPPPVASLTRPPPPELDDLLVFKRPSPQKDTEGESSEMRQSQRNKYKAKIDKAKRNFMDGESKASVGDLSRTKEEFENKHKVTLDKYMRPYSAPRGPLLQKFNDPIFKSNVDIRYREVKPNYKTPEPLWDDEYKKLVAKAEDAWREYRMRSNPNLYKKSRAYSLGYLETDLDSGARARPEPDETNLDDIHQSHHAEQPRGRARTKSSNNADDGQMDSAHSRAKSMDYLIDHRDKIEPPENELHKTVAKILGHPPMDHTPSEHELRFKKSLEQLHVPNWYLESDHFGKPGEINRGSRERRTMPSISSRATTPGYGYRDTDQSFSLPGQGDMSYNSSYSRPTSALPTPSYQKPYIAPIDDNIPNADTRYSKPWSYIDDSKNATPPKLESAQPAPDRDYREPRGSTGRYVPTVVPGSDLLRRVVPHDVAVHGRSDSPTQTRPRASSQSKSDKGFPVDMFDRYKEEINEMWHSRKSLRQSQSSLHKTEPEPSPIQPISRPAGSVPIAAVKPRPQGYDSVSPTPSSQRYGATSQASTLTHQSIPTQPYQRPKDLDIPPAYAAPPPPSGLQPDEIYTSTPLSSEHLPRKQYPQNHHVEDAVSPPPVPAHGYTKNAAATSPPKPYARAYQGYTVAPVPASYNEPRSRTSRVIEVADLGHGHGSRQGSAPEQQIASRITLEEVLDSLLGLPGRGTGRVPIGAARDAAPIGAPTLPTGQPIFTANHDAMLAAASNPNRAQDILRSERLFVRCQYCGKVNPLEHASSNYVTCRYCYTYYCGRDCRKADWDKHVDACSFSRISTLCKEVIVKVRMDTEAQFRMSKLARGGYSDRGRGSVNFRFRYPHYAILYLDQGWDALVGVQPDCLFYYTVQDLSAENKDRQLISSCRRYNPQTKFVLSVSIIADCDVVPETPMGMRRGSQAFQNRAQSLPPKAVKRSEQRQPESIKDAKVLLKSILRSMENIAPGEPELDDRRTPSSLGPKIDSFQRGTPVRHTVSSAPQQRGRSDSGPRYADSSPLHPYGSYRGGRIVGHGTESFV